MNRRQLGNLFFSLSVGMSGIIYTGLYTLADRITLELGWSPDAIGFLVSLYSAGSFSSMLISGIWADRLGKRRMVRIALCAATLGCLLLVLGGNALVILPGVYLLAMGASCGEIQSSAILTERNAGNAARWMNISQMFFCLGAIGAPVAAVWLSTNSPLGYRSIFLILTVLAAAMFLVAKMQSRPSPKPESTVPLSLNLFHILSKTPFLLICLMLFLYAGYETLSVAFLKPYATRLGLSETAAAATISVFWAFMIIGRFIGVFLGRQEARGIAAFGVVFLAGTAITLLARTPLLLFVGAALLGFGCGPVWPLLIVLGSRQNPNKNGTSFAVMSLFSSGGGIVFPSLLGLLPASDSLAFLLCAALAAILLILLGVSKRQVTADELQAG